MSVLLNGTSQFLRGSTPITAYPFSISIWIKHTNLTTNQCPLSIGSTTTFNDHHYVYCLPGTSEARSYSRTSATGPSFATTSPYANNVWLMMTGVWAGDADRRIFVNGALKQTNSESRLFSAAINQMAVGARIDTSSGDNVSAYFQGNLGYAALWSRALSDADVASLILGTSVVPPNTAQPTGLVWYASYKDDLTSDIGITLTPVAGAAWDPDNPTEAAPDPPVAYTAWQPSRLRACWTTPNGVDLKRSHTTDSYSGGNPTAVTDLKSSIANYSTGNLKSGLTVGGDIKPSILKVP